jgi:hypothetical protein
MRASASRGAAGSLGKETAVRGSFSAYPEVLQAEPQVARGAVRRRSASAKKSTKANSSVTGTTKRHKPQTPWIFSC